jgi:methyl-accepting chemotaxis protein
MGTSLSNLKIGTKIYGALSLVLLLMVILSAFVLTKLANIGTELITIAEEDMPLTRNVVEITKHQLEQSILLERALRIGGVMDNSGMLRLKAVEDKFREFGHKADEHTEKAINIARHALSVAHNAREKEEFGNAIDKLEQLSQQHTSFMGHA